MDRITRYIISLFTALAVSVAALAANAGPEPPMPDRKRLMRQFPLHSPGRTVLRSTSNPCFSAT